MDVVEGMCVECTFLLCRQLPESLPHTKEDVAMPPESLGTSLTLDSSAAQAAIQHEHHGDGLMDMSDDEVVAVGPRQASPSHEPLQLHAARQAAADNNEKHEARSGEMGASSPSSANEDYEMRGHGIDMEAPAAQRPQSEFHPTELKTEPQVPIIPGVSGTRNQDASPQAAVDSTADTASSDDSDLDSCLFGPANGNSSARRTSCVKRLPYLERRTKKMAVLEKQRERQESLVRDTRNRQQGVWAYQPCNDWIRPSISSIGRP
jgi:hypothetical protein